MKLLLIGIIIFLVVLYVYTFIKYKKRKKSNVSAVEEFKRKYHKEQLDDDTYNQDDSVVIYKTKYNSDLDYIEPGQLIQECQEMKEPKPAKKFGKLQF